MQTESQKILIIGATSAIAQEVARIYARRQSRLCLVARNQTKLRIVADDLRARGAQAVDVLARELALPDTHADIIKHALAFLQDIDVVLIAYGSLPDQAACEADAEQTMNELQVNFLSVAALLMRLANTLEQRGHGTLAVISSVAGDRGRQSNYVYGAAKGGLSIFLQGLRNRLAGKGVQVLTIKPGFVDTPMTAEFKKGPLWASARKVAADIVRAIDRRRDVAYVPWFWQGIMLVIKAIPERIFKRLKL